MRVSSRFSSAIMGRDERLPDKAPFTKRVTVPRRFSFQPPEVEVIQFDEVKWIRSMNKEQRAVLAGKVRTD
jgi:hypothetical protein